MIKNGHKFSEIQHYTLEQILLFKERAESVQAIEDEMKFTILKMAIVSSWGKTAKRRTKEFYQWFKIRKLGKKAMQKTNNAQAFFSMWTNKLKGKKIGK